LKKTDFMKHLLIIAAMATAVVSCKSKTTPETSVLSAKEMADSIEFAKFKEQKVKDEAVAAYKASHPAVVVKTAPAAQTTTKKKGWSKAAKGAAIGAGTGAVAGAIINKKNRAAGAVVGGVVGAGAGYGIGRAQDKKDGRN
jgi:YMGG-like Gly-zipper